MAVVKNRYQQRRRDLTNREVVQDGQLSTSRKPDDIPAFVQAALAAFAATGGTTLKGIVGVSVEVARTAATVFGLKECMTDEKQLDGSLTQQTASAEAKRRHAFCCKFKRER